MTKAIFTGLATALFVAATIVACGGGSSPTGPSTGGGGGTSGGGTSGGGGTGGGGTGGGGTVTDSATITIGTDGRVSPSTVTITRGGRVTIVNNDTRDHEMSSDPHPEHTQCPEINQIGFLSRGQQRTSGNLNTARTCGFHDHLRESDAGMKGSIIIQ